MTDTMRLLDLVRYARTYLHDEKLITDEEYAELVAVGAESARRLEGYDEMRRRIAALEAENARLRASNIDLKSRLESTWAHYHNCVDALGFQFHELPEDPKKELAIWRELREDRERLEKIVKNQAREIILLAKKAYPVNDAARKGEGR